MGKYYLTGYKKFMNDGEVRLLLTYVNRNLTPPIRLVFYLLIFVGLRVSEAVRLRERELHGNRITFNLAKSGRPHSRIVPNFLVALLNDYITKNKHKFVDGYIFSTNATYKNNSRNVHIHRSSIGWYVKRFRDLYGLTDVYYIRKGGSPLYRISTHTLRHWFLTKLYETTGKDLILTASIIGHKKINTTVEYITAWEKFKREEKIVNQISVFPNLAIT